MKFIAELPWPLIIILCVTLGLAPFSPPHIWEKLQMLFKGELVRPLDWFDFIMHGTPWLLLVLKIIVTAQHH
ncbi:MAG: RND transporter [Proteobacteria bacterium]|nr:RND transporter [Pseudomonadota bacterium]MBU1708743.1 RND transporter [Pseudomonadota bacterium]